MVLGEWYLRKFMWLAAGLNGLKRSESLEK